ncbi:MAG: hypothetical protein HRT67_11870 [Flavobacteriaceae bacterium]|nr:hypothetical protein [Flavobacteriaceae bacterium]
MNYFYSSLGNAMQMDCKTIACFKILIKKHKISAIYFVLANDNKIVWDALTKKCFSGIRGLEILYRDIAVQQKESQLLWSSKVSHFAIMSYYLNHKIELLQQNLSQTNDMPLFIGAKIYDRKQHTFKTVYSELLCLRREHLN